MNILKPLASFGGKIVSKFPKQALWVTQHRAEIFTGIGLVSEVGAIVFASRASYKLHDVRAELQFKLDEAEALLAQVAELDQPDRYTTDDMKHDQLIAYVNFSKSVAKLYAPAAACLALSATMIIRGHNTLRKENLALAATLTSLMEAQRAYRDRVAAALGVEKEQELYSGVTTEVVTDKKGNVIETNTVVDPSCLSPYARWFDAGTAEHPNRNWNEFSPLMNLGFLKGQQNWACDKLKSQGYLFLNEVYHMLGLPDTEAGQLVGWVYGGDGDDFVDFGLFNNPSPEARNFVNGVEQLDEHGRAKPILLDFNCDGVIYDIFNKRKFKAKMADHRA